MNGSCDWSRVALALIVVLMFLATPYLGRKLSERRPCSIRRFRVKQERSPEGAFKNFVNWIGNVVAPIGAGGAVFGAVVAFIACRTFGRWLLASAMLLAISGVTRLLEFWVLQGVGGVRSRGFAGAAFDKALSPIVGPLSSTPRSSACRRLRFSPTLSVSSSSFCLRWHSYVWFLPASLCGWKVDRRFPLAAVSQDGCFGASSW